MDQATWQTAPLAHWLWGRGHALEGGGPSLLEVLLVQALALRRQEEEEEETRRKRARGEMAAARAKALRARRQLQQLQHTRTALLAARA